VAYTEAPIIGSCQREPDFLENRCALFAIIL
jgi:hypothetical protein